MRHHILPARMQPPHRDHLALLTELTQRLPGPLILGLIVHAPVTGPPRDAMDAAGREHAAAERNPFDYFERVAMLEQALPSRVRHQLHILPLPRPEANWAWVDALLPRPRCWIVPVAGEAFDDQKARWLTARGEVVLRVPQPVTTDGWQVRRLLAAGDPAVRAHLHPAVAALAERWIPRPARDGGDRPGLFSVPPLADASPSPPLADASTTQEQP